MVFILAISLLFLYLEGVCFWAGFCWFSKKFGKDFSFLIKIPLIIAWPLIVPIFLCFLYKATSLIREQFTATVELITNLQNANKTTFESESFSWFDETNAQK